jgi:hypothetical protein
MMAASPDELRSAAIARRSPSDDLAHPGTLPPPEADLVRLIGEELGLAGPDAVVAAISLADRVRYRHIQRLADQIIADQLASRDQRLEAAHVIDALAFLDEPDTAVSPLLGQLAEEGHNVTLTAQFKAGKTTLIGNAAAALTAGGSFLGRFPVGHPRRVAWLNYELTVDDQRSLVRALAIPTDALERLLVLNLRGVRLSLTTPTGRDWLVAQLRDHGAEVLIGDTYGAAVAPSIDSENDNAAARRFLATIDEIKALAGCASSMWTAHTGRKTHEEGSEHARGATVLDDWADVRLVLTKDRQSGARFLSSEGRSSYDLPESALHYDPASRGLWLPESAVGANRAEVRAEAGAQTASRLVSENPGIMTTELRDMLGDTGVGNNTDRASALRKARTLGLVHTHRDGHKIRHYAGQLHPEGTPCTA